MVSAFILKGPAGSGGRDDLPHSCTYHSLSVLEGPITSHLGEDTLA